MVMAFDIFVM